MSSIARALCLTVSLLALAPSAVWAAGPSRPAVDEPVVKPDRRSTSLWGRSFSGAYLAGRHAEREFDLGTAADQLERALALAPDNLELQQRVFLLKLSDGRFDASLPHARKLVDAQDGLTLSVMRVALEQVRQGDYAAARKLVETIPPLRYNAAARPILLAWIALADQGRDAALAALESSTNQRGFLRLLALHRALINDVAGRPDAAAAAFSSLMEGDGDPSLRVVQLATNFYARQGDTEQASALRDAYQQTHPQSVTLMPEPVATGGTPEPLIRDARDGIAETLFNLAGIYYDDRELAMALVHARLAEGLRPGYPMSTLLIGEILETQKRYADALALYAAVGEDTPFAAALALRVARNLDQQDRTDEAVRVLEAFAADKRPGGVETLLALGHILRGRERFQEATQAYDRAIEQVDTLQPQHWGYFYARGIALERSGEWERAQADLKQALTLSPEQPYVLNYLGYSWIDRRDNLEEAEGLVRRASELRPEDGFIADSLGWVYFVTGRYEEAVRELERAVQLEPGDPTINEHLGDAYWKVGRRNEARFQWAHALRMDPDEKRVAAIEAKVECGLDGCPVKAARGG